MRCREKNNMKITRILLCLLIITTSGYGQQISRYRYGYPPISRDYSLQYDHDYNYYDRSSQFRKNYDSRYSRYDHLNFSRSKPNIYGGQDFYSPYGNRVLQSKPNIYGGYNYYRY